MRKTFQILYGSLIRKLGFFLMTLKICIGIVCGNVESEHVLMDNVESEKQKDAHYATIALRTA